MRISLLTAGQRFLVWVVATATSFEALLQMIVAAIHLQWSDFFVWGLGGAGLFMLAFFLEKVKSFKEE